MARRSKATLFVVRLLCLAALAHELGARTLPSYHPIQAAGAARAHDVGPRAAPEVDARPRDRTGTCGLTYS